MRTDALQRRLRFAPPQPTAKRIALHDDDLAVFEAIHRHGPLPSTYLHRFTASSLGAFQHRLTKLFHGTSEGGYLARPPQQFASFAARYQPVVYDLNERSRQLLAERGRLSPFIRRTDPFVHRLMGACVGASIELACAGLRYIARHEILARKGSGLALPLSPTAAQHRLVPDELFGLDYGGAYRFFAVEIDRNTESIERGRRARNSFANKLNRYLDAIRHRRHREHWGVPNLLVLIVTTNATHMRHLMAHLGRLDRELSARFLFKAVPEFGANWRIPPIMDDILDPWPRADGTSFDIRKP